MTLDIWMKFYYYMEVTMHNVLSNNNKKYPVSLKEGITFVGLQAVAFYLVLQGWMWFQ